MFLLQPRKVPLRIPNPRSGRSKQKVHFLKRSLIRLRVQRPDHGYRYHVGYGEDIQCFLADAAEHDWAKKCLDIISYKMRMENRHREGILPASHFQYSNPQHPMRCLLLELLVGRSQRDTTTGPLTTLRQKRR